MTGMKGMSYPNLLSPLKLGPIHLPNRVVMGSMHTGMEDWPWQLSDLATFYAERAAGGVGLIITGGFSPTLRGTLYPLASNVTFPWSLWGHRKVTEGVHANGGKILLQLLHAGRYSVHPFSQAPSALRARINRFTPTAMSDTQINHTIRAYGTAAKRAQQAGYDGVEIMGSEGYLLNQFLARCTNQRTDHYGGSFENRARLSLAVVRAVRAACGDDFAIVYRQSMLDLVEGGLSAAEVDQLALWLEAAGVDALNTGIGWHESKVPTIVTSVPRAAFSDCSARIKQLVDIPVIASNRINVPEVAETILAAEQADLVSMARPLLADSAWVQKAASGQSQQINVCIACNQACLDHVFIGKKAGCLVNPRAGREREISLAAVASPKTLHVVGAGPAGLSAAVEAARRGHRVMLYERSAKIGGQFNLAAAIPGKEEFKATLVYYQQQLRATGVQVQLNTAYTVGLADKADHVILASGVQPRQLAMQSNAKVQVIPYDQLLSGQRQAGRRVAVIGAGGIGFDVSSYLIGSDSSQVNATWRAQWGVETAADGGLVAAAPAQSNCEAIYLLQRKTTKHGKGLGLTSGWVHRSHLQHAGVEMLGGVDYLGVDEQGLQIKQAGLKKTLAVDTVVICAGQTSVDGLARELEAVGQGFTVIGGAKLAAELDAKRAIREGMEAVLALG